MGLSVETSFLTSAAGNTTLVGTFGLPSVRTERLAAYDLAVTHIPGIAADLRAAALSATVVRHGFGRQILDSLGGGEPIPISFVGSFTQKHERRIDLLETLCASLPVRVWAPDLSYLSEDSPIRDCYEGQAWGRDMYDIIARSKVTLNVHVDGVSVPANVRLYEATGVETALVTDAMDGMDEIFEPGVELCTYQDAADCVDTLEKLLAEDTRRKRVAAAGQERTLAEHTCERRAATLLDAIQDVR